MPNPEKLASPAFGRAEKCLVCNTLILVIGEASKSAGAVAFSRCPSVDRSFQLCEGRTVELSQTEVGEVLKALLDSSDAVGPVDPNEGSEA